MPGMYCDGCQKEGCTSTRGCKTYMANRYKVHQEEEKANSRARDKANPARAWARNSINKHKYRGYQVELTIPEVVNLYHTTPRCKYCGRIMVRGTGILHSLSPTLDRTDNSEIMTLANTQLICIECNTTKGARTHDEFLLYMKEVLQRFGYEVRQAYIVS